MTQTALIQSVYEHILKNYEVTRLDGGESISLADLNGDEELSKLFGQFFEPSKKSKKSVKQEKPKKTARLVQVPPARCVLPGDPQRLPSKRHWPAGFVCQLEQNHRLVCVRLQRHGH